jgi:hypothetical protein
LCRAMLRCRVPKNLYTNRLAPGFLSDWQEHSSILVQTAPSNFRALAVESERELTSTSNNSYGTLAKTIKTINWSFLPPYNVYLTWLAMRVAY